MNYFLVSGLALVLAIMALVLYVWVKKSPLTPLISNLRVWGIVLFGGCAVYLVLIQVLFLLFGN